METSDNCRRAEGVGVSYHPFLHDTLLNCRDLFDFVELPLDLYVDPARAALLDPGQHRLRQILDAKRCVWRGSALSLGTVGPDDDAGFSPHTLRRIRTLLDMIEAEPYADIIGFRAAEFGPLQAMPFTTQAAHWIAIRQAAAQDALGVPVRPCLPGPVSDTRRSELDVADFLNSIVAHGGSGFVLDATDLSAADLGSDAARDLAARLPAAHIEALSVSGTGGHGWETLRTLADHIRPATVILRRDRQLFPLDTIETDIACAGELVARPAHEPPPAAVVPPQPANSADLAALRLYQSAPAPDEASRDLREVAGQSWQNWRTQVDDLHKAQQIMALMSKGANPPAAWRG